MLEPLPLSLLNDFLYCQRRAALKIVEGCRSANEHTARGDIVHEHADLPGYEIAKGATLLRALPVWSERLGLNGKYDIVEVHPNAEGDKLKAKIPSEPPHVGCYEKIVPVEFKLGKRRKWENDDVQLCAQAICLEEMLAVPFHAAQFFMRTVNAGAKWNSPLNCALGQRTRPGSCMNCLHRNPSRPPSIGMLARNVRYLKSACPRPPALAAGRRNWPVNFSKPDG